MLQAAVKPSLEAGDLYFQLRRIAEQGKMSEDEFTKLLNELLNVSLFFAANDCILAMDSNDSPAPYPKYSVINLAKIPFLTS